MRMDEGERDGSQEELDAMHHREITLADGRYMIFYTFGETVENLPVCDGEDRHV